jgi:hypothetical protein
VIVREQASSDDTAIQRVLAAVVTVATLFRRMGSSVVLLTSAVFVAPALRARRQLHRELNSGRYVWAAIKNPTGKYELIDSSYIGTLGWETKTNANLYFAAVAY